LDDIDGYTTARAGAGPTKLITYPRETRRRDTLARVLADDDVGTLFVPSARKLQGRKRWIAFFHHAKGALHVDAGAKKALREAGKSLLPPGITRCEGDFQAGDVVRLCVSV